MKNNYVSLRLIKKILNINNLEGFNDLRTFGRRIKLKSLLSVGQSIYLQDQLDRIFPQFKIEVRAVLWQNGFQFALDRPGTPVTAIYVRE